MRLGRYDIMWRCARVTSPRVNLIIMNFNGVIYIGTKPQNWVIPSMTNMES